MTVVYRLGSRLSNRLSAKEVIKLHLLHSEENGNKVLFTINKGPSANNRDKIDKIILTTANGEYAVKANVEYLGSYDIGLNPPKDFAIPSIWNNENKDKKAWFALSDMKIIEGGIKEGDYKSAKGKDLLQSIKGTAFMIYLND